MRVCALAARFGVGDDDVDARHELARLEQTQTVRTSLLDERHAVVAQRARVDVHLTRVRTRRPLNTNSLSHIVHVTINVNHE